MRTLWWILLIGGVLLVANFFTLFSPLNEPLNTLIAGPPDKTCGIDEDCVVEPTTCEPCDCGDAVNKEWGTFCPFGTLSVFCKMCPGLGTQCIDGTCAEVRPPRVERK